MQRQDLLNSSNDLFKGKEQQEVEVRNLRNALKHIENRAGEYAVHEKGTCSECDALHEILFAARKAINFHASASSI